jgi:aminoglycoside phosphotransferase family enzyme
MLATVSVNDLPAIDEQDSRSSLSRRHEYKIKKTIVSESSMVFFASCSDTKQRFVIKILRKYEDTRYSLADPQKRLACQIEALKWNQKFTPSIYLGLGTIVEADLDEIEQKAKENRLHSLTIEDITNDFQQLANTSRLQCEYALVMESLPKERRLDILLQKKNIASIHEILEVLVKRIVEMHNSAPHPDIIALESKEKPWGSYEQLKDKLFHNMELFDNLERLNDRSFYQTYQWLKEDLLVISKDPAWSHHFNNRLEHKRIKRCHGDLKARNIWIEPAENSSDAEYRVRLLDAIDFNPSYCNIDVLSDIAMLIIDVQAVDTHLHEHNWVGTRGWDLAQFVLETYFAYAKDDENNETTRLVLTYYLLEKALVRASISLFYDRNEYPQLGPYFLKIAVMYMEQLKDLLHAISPSSIDKFASVM